MRNEILAQFIADSGIHVAEFARRIGLTETSVHRYISGERVPEPDVMDNIFRETGGAVPHDSWTPMLVARHRARRKRRQRKGDAGGAG